MVPLDITNNMYHLREYFFQQIKMLSEDDSHKHALMVRLGYFADAQITLPPQLYKKCAVSGFNEKIFSDTEQSLFTLLGQASYIDITPSPWVSDMWAVLGIKLAVDMVKNQELEEKFYKWINSFLPKRVKNGQLDPYEQTIIDFISGNNFTLNSNASIVLFFHFQGIVTISDPLKKCEYITCFLNEFKEACKSDLSPVFLGVMVYVFDRINDESALVPPNNWHLDNLISFLESIPLGLRRWTWEDAPKTKNSGIVKWSIENEYHVQNLLYLLLAPIFHDITDENYTDPVGQKNPRIDLYLPSIHTIIEVKYRKFKKKNFQSFIEEVAADASLYKADPKYKNCKLVIFLWDHAGSTQEHAKFKEGIMKISGIDGCVVVCSPSTMI